jgi:uncharacterized protein (TIGR02246 family)
MAAKMKAERSMVIAAAQDRVWSALTNAAQISKWFDSSMQWDFEPVSGSNMTFRYEGKVLGYGKVVTADPKTHFAFHWTPEPGVPVESLVTFRLEPVGDGTRVTVSEEGFEALPDDLRQRRYEMNSNGWSITLRELDAYLQAPDDESFSVIALYRRLLDCWNFRSAAAYAALFLDDGRVVGFDGSLMNGKAEIETTLGGIFSDHPTAAYVSKVRGVDFLALDVAVVRAVAGMIPPGEKDIKPERNAIQTLIAVRQDGAWKISLFQNTPAQFHGRPELVEALTDELRQLL